MKKKQKDYAALLAILGQGHENAISVLQAAQILRIDSRTVRILVLHARLDGLPLCGDSGKGGGLYLARTDAEKRSTVCRLRRRARTHLMAAAAMERGDTEVAPDEKQESEG